MNKITRKILITGLFLFSFAMSSILAQAKFKLVNFTTKDGGKIEAAFFNAGLDQAVIFTHGAIFNKESWYFLAEKFQKIGISSLAIDFRGYGKSTAPNSNKKYFDVLGAIQYLKEKGVKEIDIIGASMGGAAVLAALKQTPDSLISKVVLLAPAGGPPISSKTINKLFIVSKKERLYNRVKTIFNKSAKPKTLKVYNGNVHAQHLFKTNYAKELTKLIIGFINN